MMLFYVLKYIWEVLISALKFYFEVSKILKKRHVYEINYRFVTDFIFLRLWEKGLLSNAALNSYIL